MGLRSHRKVDSLPLHGRRWSQHVLTLTYYCRRIHRTHCQRLTSLYISTGVITMYLQMVVVFSKRQVNYVHYGNRITKLTLKHRVIGVPPISLVYQGHRDYHRYTQQQKYSPFRIVWLLNIQFETLPLNNRTLIHWGSSYTGIKGTIHYSQCWLGIAFPLL